MNKNRLYAVILAGGKGERFWPLSTASRPKQFISLFGGRPLIALALERQPVQHTKRSLEAR